MKNLIVKRLWVKPYKDAFENELTPAFYNENETEPSFRNGIVSLKDNILALDEMIYKDRKSYDVLASVIVYRLTANKNVLFYYISDLQNIYYDDEIIGYFRKDWRRCMIDCGAYVGDTLLQFHRKYKMSGTETYICFEAEKSNFKKLEYNSRRIGKYGTDVVCHNCAVGMDNETVNIESRGNGSRIDSNAGEEIKMVRLDDTISRNVTFIKMDIEGSELEALKGCERIIKHDRPVLAISIYHKLSDIFSIYNFIKELSADYQFAVRKYGNGVSELVLYAF